MDRQTASIITDALKRPPGLILVTGKPGEVALEVCGRRDLEHWGETFTGNQSGAALATQRALGLAMMHGLPLLIRFVPKGFDQ